MTRTAKTKSSLGLVASLTAIAGAYPVAAQDKVHVIGSALYAPGHNFADSIMAYGESVTEASDGNIDFEWFFGDALAKPPEMPDSLADGIVNIGYVTPAYSPADFTIDGWVSLMGYGNDPRPVVGLLSAGAAMMEFGFTEPGIVDELKAKGVYPLIPRFQSWDNYQLLCKEPVESLADAKGKRVRVGGAAFIRVADALGMSPVSLSGAEIYEGLDRGVVDCFIGGEGDMIGLGLWEIASHYTALGLPGWNSTAIGMGEEFFEGLSDDDKSAFIDNLAAYVEAYFSTYLTNQYRYFKEGAEQHGLVVHEPDAEFQAAIRDYYAGIDEVLVTEAPSVVPNAAESVERFKALQEKWTKIVLDLGLAPEQETRVDWVAANPDGVSVDISPWVEAVKTEIFNKYLPLENQ